MRASPMLRSSSTIPAHVNRFSRTNELLSIKPVLLGIDWIPLILWFPLPSEKKLRPSPMLSPFSPNFIHANRFYKKIRYSLISQFRVDRFDFAKLAYCHIGDSLSKNGFGVTDTSNPVARDFLNSKKVSTNNLSKTWQSVWQWTERNTDGNLWLELPDPSFRRHILRIRVIIGIIGERMNVCFFH